SAKAVDEQQPAGERFSYPQQEFDGLAGLPCPDDARQRAEDPSLRAGRAAFERRRLRIEAAITRAGVAKYADLSVETKDRTVDVGPAFEKACVVGQVTRRKVVAAIEHDVIQAHELARVAGIETTRDGIDRDERIDGVEAVRRGDGLVAADVCLGEDRLTLKVGFVDGVVVDHADAADARGG